MGFAKSLLSKAGLNIGNLKDYPVHSMNYFVILGTSILSFSKISGIHLYHSKTMAVNEGGMLEPYIVEEPNNELNTLKFEKGYGTVDVLDMVHTAKTMLLIIKGQDHKVKGIYYTSRMMVRDVTLSDLDASKSAILIQNLTISYTALKRAPYSMKMGLSALFDAFDYNDNSAEKEEIRKYAEKLSSKNLKKQKSDTMPSDGKTQYQREREQIEKDTKQLKALKEAKIHQNQQVDMASKVNHKIREENRKKEEEARKKEEEKQQQIENLIEL